jgi:carbon-monoxide dehydrogenase small subunit
MAVDALLAGDPDPDELTVREAISGNLCRCTGYGRILDAVDRAAAIRREAHP